MTPPISQPTQSAPTVIAIPTATKPQTSESSRSLLGFSGSGGGFSSIDARGMSGKFVQEGSGKIGR
jgi:hypothetical protein